jgi:DNA polymerase elongation subunit (family B)
MSKIRRLFFDIETSMDVGVFFGPGRKISIDHFAIEKERAVICICYKWDGESKVHAVWWDKNQDDRKLLQDFLKVANTADELVAHNGKAFDIKWIRGRCWMHQIPMFPKYTVLDTLTESRALFRLNSHRLDYMSKVQGGGGKGKTDFSMWKELTFRNPPEVLNRMVRYCKRDVLELQRVFNSMKPYMKAVTHHGVINGSDKEDCPECGSKEMRKVRLYVTAAGHKRRQLQCKKCNKHHTIAYKE